MRHKLTQRDQGLDITRFAYIFMMIAYHCFQNVLLISPETIFNINSYLGLVSGSFPFLAGYLVSFHYLRKTTQPLTAISLQLAIRSGRLLGVYATINILFLIWLYRYLPDGFVTSSPQPWKDILLANPIVVSYDILVPIALTLLAGSLLAIGARYLNKHLLVFIAFAVVGVSIATHHPYFACGVCGLAVGFRHVDKPVSQLFEHLPVVILAIGYGLAFAYLADTPRHHEFLYLLGVVTLFYALRVGGNRFSIRHAWVQREIMLFARYSLFIYLSHVPTLIILMKIFSGPLLETHYIVRFLVTLTVIYLLMGALVRVVEKTRKVSPSLNRLYQGIFA